MGSEEGDNRPNLGGYEFGFMCDCDEAEVGNPHTELRDAVGDGDTVECEHCGATFRVDITRVDDGE